MSDNWFEFTILVFLHYVTHVQFSRVENFWNNLGYHSIAIQEAQRCARGLWVLTTKDNYSYWTLDSQRQAITFEIGLNLQTWMCIAIYGSPILTCRSQLWDYLKELRNRISKPWMLLEDFNKFLLPSEVNRGTF